MSYSIRGSSGEVASATTLGALLERINQMVNAAEDRDYFWDWFWGGALEVYLYWPSGFHSVVSTADLIVGAYWATRYADVTNRMVMESWYRPGPLQSLERFIASTSDEDTDAQEAFRFIKEHEFFLTPGDELVVVNEIDRPPFPSPRVGEHLIVEEHTPGHFVPVLQFNPEYGPDGTLFSLYQYELKQYTVFCPPEEAFKPYLDIYRCYAWAKERDGLEALNEAGVPSPYYHPDADLLATGRALVRYLEACYNDGLVSGNETCDPRPRKGDDKELDRWLEAVRRAVANLSDPTHFSQRQLWRGQ